MTETQTFNFLWEWDKEQIKAAVNKNKTIQKIRKDLLKARTERFLKKKQLQKRHL